MYRNIGILYRQHALRTAATDRGAGHILATNATIMMLGDVYSIPDVYILYIAPMGGGQAKDLACIDIGAMTACKKLSVHFCIEHF